MRVFTEDDVQTRINSITNEPLAYINGLVPDNLVDKPLAWQLKDYSKPLQATAQN